MTRPKINETVARMAIYHGKILLGTLLVAVFFSIMLLKRVFHPGLPNMLILTFLQLELFFWMGRFFFRGLQPDSPGFLRKTVIRLILFFASAFTCGFVLFIGIYFFHFLQSDVPFSEFLSRLNNAAELRAFLKAAFVGFGFGTLIFFYIQWAEAIKRTHKLKEEKLIFQYETLKSQVNPHFLFNSLNTLSSLVGKDPVQSEEFIQKLSSVYRYVLENQGKDLVPVSSELSFVRDYFALQQVRDQDKIELKIENNGPENAMIMPVSLQMLVENALKHNIASRKEPLLITIHFEGLDKLTVRNNLQPRNQLKASSKIGLKNLNERCRLILGREIESQKTMEEFVVKIPVKTELS